MTTVTTRRLAIYLAVAAMLVLVLMVIVGKTQHVSQEEFEHVSLPEHYAATLVAKAGGLRALMALDVAFLVLYTAFFSTLARYLHAFGRPFLKLALGAMIGTAVLDIIEDHHILAMLESAEHGVLPAARSLTEQAALSMTKFTLSYLSLFMFGLAIPRDTKQGIALAVFLTAGNLLSAVIGYALPPAHQALFDGSRWVGFLLGLGLAIAWLAKSPDEAASA